MSSPRKKIKLDNSPSKPKRSNSNSSSASSKRLKVEKEVDIHTLKRKNFVSACEQVSYQAYYDFQTRLQLIYIPRCVDPKKCKHQDSGERVYVREIPNYSEESVNIELKTNMWKEALEVCQLCITPEQYLSANVLKEIIEIIMNVHENEDADHSATDIIEQSQQILSQNFSAHPPCGSRLRNLYKTFLTSAMDLKGKTFTNRTDFECDKGIVKYCMNRLEYEVSSDSKDQPLVDKYENIPEDMKQSVKGAFWKREKLEIFEVLERHERIQRLMAVLESIIELLQFDLVIWHSKYTNNLGNHMMRSHKPLMAYVLWSSVLFTGAVNNNCRQILRLFAHMVHLRYPQEYIRIMTTWLNTIIQTFYICESNSNSDYPNTGKYCMAFAKEFYRIIADLPHETIIRILNTIQPPFMVNLIGTLHTQTLLNIQEDSILKIFLHYVNKSLWVKFIESRTEIEISKKSIIKPKKVKDVLKYLAKTFDLTVIPEYIEICDNSICRKMDEDIKIIESDLSQSEMAHILYITIEAFLDAYSVQYIQDTIDSLNERLSQNGSGDKTDSIIPEHCSYSVSEHFIKKYRTIFQVSTELVSRLYTMNANKELPPSIMKISQVLGFIES